MRRFRGWLEAWTDWLDSEETSANKKNVKLLRKEPTKKLYPNIIDNKRFHKAPYNFKPREKEVRYENKNQKKDFQSNSD